MIPLKSEKELLKNWETFSDSQKNDIFLQLDELSTDSLYERIGDFSEELHGFPPSIRELINSGKVWVEDWRNRNKKKLRKIICNDIDYCNKIKSPKYKDKLSLASIIADALFMNFVNIPFFTVTIILLNMGLEDFCECY